MTLDNDKKAAAKKAALLAAKRKKLAALLMEKQKTAVKQKQDNEKGIPGIAKRDSSDSAVTSFAQQRLWFIDQLEGGSSHYNICVTCQVHGEFDIARATLAFKALIARHLPLHTVYHRADTNVWQTVRKIDDFEIDVTDLTNKSVDLISARSQQIASETRNHVFDLANDLMLNVSWVKQTEQQGQLTLCMHHIAADGWSMQILVNEFFAAYNNRSDSLAVPEIDYADYAHWQRQHLNSDKLDTALTYWSKQLADLPTVHNLTLDFERPAEQSWRGGNLAKVVSAETLAALNSLAQQHKITLFMLLHGAFSLLLSRFSNKDDIVIGTPVAGRYEQSLETLIGCFVNTLVLRNQVDEANSLADFFDHIRETNLNAQQHQQVPFETLVEVLKPERNRSWTPLFQIMFSMDPDLSHISQGDGFTVSDFKAVDLPAKFDLTLNASELDGQFYLNFNYNLDLFSAETVERMAHHLVLLLDAMVNVQDAATTPLHQISMLDDSDRTFLLDTVNDQPVIPGFDEAIKTRRINEYLEQQAASQPNAIAATFLTTAANQATISYGELNTRANQLAHWICQQTGGVLKPDQLIGVSTSRSENMLIAVFAVIKAGGAYVPLDPAYPADRLAYMIDNSAIELVLTEAAVLQQEVLPSGVQALALDEAHVKQALASQPETNLTLTDEHRVSDLAYIIYTSGSTGKPKGVMIQHVNIVALAEWALAFYTPQEFAGVLGSTSLSFDLSAYEIFVTLAAGGQLKVVENVLSLNELTDDVLATNGPLTMINTVPSGIQAILSRNNIPESVNVINLAGERLPMNLANGLLAQKGLDRVINLYGPSEDTTYSSGIPLSAGLTLDQHPVIGKPFYGTQIYILDEYMNPTPVGVFGELWLAGAGLSRGYLNRADITAERFVPNPFAKAELDNTVMYKSGDVVRWLADGNMDIQGRVDNQIKLRGFRIELEEIDTGLQLLPEIKAAATIVHYPVAGDDASAQLVAYITLNGEYPADGTETQALFERCKTHLSGKVPGYMVPEVYVLLEQMPLSPNGKFSRKLLPAPDAAMNRMAMFVAPETTLEKQLASIWQSLLNVEQVGLTDNFFHLGGHSLLAERMISELSEQTGLRLPLKLVFESPVLQQLAANAEQYQQNEESRLSDIEATIAPDQDAPLSLSQQRLWFIDKLEGDSVAYNMSRTFDVEGFFELQAAATALDTIIERQHALRRVVTEQDGIAQTRLLNSWETPLVITEIAELSESEQQQMIQQAGECPFDLTADVFARLHVFTQQGLPTTLVFTMHHFASDGWSAQVFFNEFCSLYNGLRQANLPQLAALPIQFADVAAWQQTQRDQLTDSANWWQAQLADTPALHSLNTDFPRPEKASHDGASITTAFSPTLSAAIQAVCQREQVTPFMLLETAFAAYLSRVSEKDDSEQPLTMVIGAPVAARQHASVNDLIGYFVNTLPLVTTCDLSQPFASLLQRNRKQILESLKHQTLPFDQIVEAVNPARDMSYSPVFQLMFDYQASQFNGLSLDDVTLTPREASHASSKFDLTLTIAEQADDVLSGEWEYATSLFSEQTIQALASGFEVWLQQLMTNEITFAKQSLASVSLLSDSQMTETLEQLVSTEAGTALTTEYSSIVEVFHRQAQQQPEAIALHGKQRWNWTALNHKAGQLANLLIARHGRTLSGERIAICMQPSDDAVIAILATLKAGAAFVPVDPAYPQTRKQHLLQDSAAVLVLTDQSVESDVTAITGEAPVLNLDTVADELVNLPTECIETGITPDHVAYIIYTSGSTGKPKGVMISHANWLAYREAALDLYQSKDSTAHRVMQFSSMAFDIFIEELTLSLLAGGSLILKSAEKTLIDAVPDNQQFWQFIEDYQISLVSLPTAYWHQLCQDGQLATQLETTSLKTVITGGEAMSVNMLRDWQAADRQSTIRVFNTYGPTETTVIATAFDASNFNGEAVPVGQAIAGLTALVLDEHQQPVPPGLAGELCLSGQSVAPGYFNRPDLTEAAFIRRDLSAMSDADPTSTVTSRFYRTGDKVKVGADGQLVFLGRIDNQVKIRGFRVEPDEIAARITACEQVADCVVTVYQPAESRSHKQLVAWLVADADSSSENTVLIANVKAALAQSLPDWMIPAGFMVLPKLPLTANGKVDKRQLPDAAECLAASQPQTAFVAPASAEEKTLAVIWSELFGLAADKISVNDDFFALGGHSLLMIRLRSLLAEQQLEATVAALYQHSTLGAMASCLTEIDAMTDVADTSDSFTEITSETRQLIADQVVGGDDNIQAIYPLSSLQEGMLYHALKADGEDPYLIRQAFSFASEASLERFIAGLEFVISRHDSLRTHIILEGVDQPLQVVCKQATLTVFRETFTRDELPSDVPVTEWLANRGMPETVALNLTSAPMMRLHVVAVDGERFAVLYHHHLQGDNFSMQVMNQEIDNWLKGQSDRLPDSAPYRHYIEASLNTDKAAAKQWFTKQLGELSEGCFPYAMTEASVASDSELSRHHLRLEPVVTQHIHELAQRHRVGVSAVLHAAWSLVVSRTANQSTVVFGTVMSGRMQPVTGIERMVGLCINTLPVRVDVSQPFNVAELLASTHQSLTSLVDFEQVPLSVAQSCAGFIGEGGTGELFSSILNCRLNQSSVEADKMQVMMEGQGISPLWSQERSNYPLTASIDETRRGLVVSVEAISPIRADRVAQYFANAIECLTANEQRIDLPSLLPVDEHEQLLVQGSNLLDEKPTSTLVDCIRQHAAQRAEHIAVACDEHALNWSQFDQKTSQLANYLIDQGVKPDTAVGVSLNRSVDMLVAMIAILKAGAGYVPLSPGYPPSRLTHMISDSGMTHLLSDTQLNNQVFAALQNSEEQLSSVQLLAIDDVAIQSCSSADPNAEITPNSLAYVIYTSGTTGLPKGVAIEHAHFSNLLLNFPQLAIDAMTGSIALANFVFDGSIIDLLMPLAHGKTVLIVNDEQTTDMSLWPALIERYGINTAFMTTQLFNLLVGEQSAVLDALTQVMFGGEQANTSAIGRWLERYYEKGYRLIHLYGPTETTVLATGCELTPENYQQIPVGMTVPGLACYLTDKSGQLSPMGAVGELLVGGASIARGYLNREELTAESFIPNTFTTDARATRLYRTGDLMRWLPTGELQFVGRADNQIKIRGFRIELEEIELQICNIANVAQTVALVVKTQTGMDKLVAAVTGDNPDASELKRVLAESLPPHMLPDLILPVATMPLTPNGKLDRNHLHSLAVDALADLASDQPYQAPQNDTEHALVSLWNELLGVESSQISTTTSFFELGGNSLLVMRLTTALKNRFGLELTVKEIFNYQTVEAQAELIDVLQSNTSLDDSSVDDNGMDEGNSDDEVSIVL